MYQGPASLIFSTNYLSHPPTTEQNDHVEIRLTNLSPGVAQLEFWQAIAAPVDANRIRVVLSSGQAFEGSIKQIHRAGNLRWLSFTVEQFE